MLSGGGDSKIGGCQIGVCPDTSANVEANRHTYTHTHTHIHTHNKHTTCTHTHTNKQAHTQTSTHTQQAHNMHTHTQTSAHLPAFILVLEVWEEGLELFIDSIEGKKAFVALDNDSDNHCCVTEIRF